MRSRTGLVATALAVSALGLATLVAGTSLPIDDFWLTLASGRALIQGEPVDRALDFTWTPMVTGALNPQWGAQLVLGSWGSTSAALIVNALLIAGGLAVLAVRTRRVATFPASAAAMVLAIGVLAPHLLARAQSFSILLAPAALLLIERRPLRPWLPVSYGLLIAVWANLHGGFVVGQLAIVIAFVAEATRRRPVEGEPRRQALVLGLTAAVALIAPVFNPAGVDLLRYAYAQPGLDVVRSISVEWQPSWPWVPVATLFWVLAILWALGRVLRRRSTTRYELMLGVALALLAASSIRHIPWFVIAVTPGLARDIAAAMAASPRLTGAVGETPGWLRGRSLAAIVLVCGVLVVLWQPVRVTLPSSVGRVTPDAPVALAANLDDRLAEGAVARVLNEQVWGGYLVYRLGDRIETAMDGRLEIRDRATWSDYFALLHGDGDPASALASSGVTWAAVAPGRERLIGKLVGEGWEIVIETAQGVLLRSDAESN